MLTNHPGTTEVHLKLVKPGRVGRDPPRPGLPGQRHRGALRRPQGAARPTLPGLSAVRAVARHTVTPCRARPHRPPSADHTSGSTTATGSRTRTPGCATPTTPPSLAHLEAENAYAEERTGAPRAAAHGDLRGDPLAREGDRPVGAGRQRPLVVLRPDGRGPPVRLPGPLPADRPVARPDPEADTVARGAGRRRRQRRGG